ncbi:MAG TPA: hypothetical protein ENK05_14790 [Gammaproteobacteria bacterium]|nr:hypothetical protein [Gammaproteobacteria bacterium]
MIDSYSFGKIEIDGNPYTSDVIIWPDHVKSPWWRAKGHVLAVDDLTDVLARPPHDLVIGTGYFGRMKVPEETKAALQSRGIRLHVHRTTEAVEEFNRLARESADVVAAFHLTC